MRTVVGRARRAVAAVGLALALAGVACGSASAATAPVKEVEAANIGWEVNRATKGVFCAVEPGSECQPGRRSGEPGGFLGSEGIAVGPEGNLYIADRGNRRVQEIEPDGKFVLMFGKDVNRKGIDVCTAAEEKECQAGQEGTAPGEFGEASAIAVDPTSGGVYVAEGQIGESRRVQEFTATGSFVLEIGREVNETKTAAIKAKGGAPTPEQMAEEDLCTVAEVKESGVKCSAPAASVQGEPRPGAFNFARESGVIAVGGPKDILYVSDEHRVQVFDAKAGASDGRYLGEIPLTGVSSTLRAETGQLAVDQAAGTLYLVYKIPANEQSQRSVLEFDASGKQAGEFELSRPINALAVDPSGRLAVSEPEVRERETVLEPSRGTLYAVTGAGLRAITHFAAHGTESMSFDGSGGLFAVFGSPQGSNLQSDEVIAYAPHEVAELVAGGTTCSPGVELGSNVTFDCTMNGEANPFGVAETKVWFDWGPSGLFGEETAKQSVSGTGPVPVSASVEGLPPNETVYDELAGEDQVVKAPEEPLTSTNVEQVSTPTVPPRVVEEPTAGFAGRTSVVMFGVVNPENASTAYEFQYAPEAACDAAGLQAGETLVEACTGVAQTEGATSSNYGQVGAVQEASDLQPATRYRYRLYATNGKGQGAVGPAGGTAIPEGTFETAPAVAVSATTGPASAIASTSAIVSGSVDPDGQPSVYRFELGVYAGSETRYGTVFTAPAGSSATPVGEELLLTGLQPGTTYAYRISIHFANGSIPGSEAIGQAMTFTTLGVQSILASPPAPPLLADPAIAFPKPATGGSGGCKQGYRRDRRGRCVKTKPRKHRRRGGTRKSTHGRRPGRRRH